MGRSFSNEFRNMIVELHLNNSKPIEYLVKEYGVSASSISIWIIVYRNKRLSEAEKLSKGVPFDNDGIRE